MHGIIGQLAADPVRLAIAIIALIAVVAIIRCLSGLAFFVAASPHEHDGRKRKIADCNTRQQTIGRVSTQSSTSPEK